MVSQDELAADYSSMARIKDEDIAVVREKARIEDVVSEHVALRSAGGGSLKGLCPFHDERGPSFHVTPSKGYYHCFGCGDGGDVITFVRKIENLSFTEAIERLAEKFNVPLHYVDGPANQTQDPGLRRRLIKAHSDALIFYKQRFSTIEAQAAKDMLIERNFDAAAMEHFSVGYAPKGWDNLTQHLLALGYSESDLLESGLAVKGQRGIYDRFRGRLMWPIKEAGGDVIGFGARKLYDDDEGPKYLNSPETPIYKKAQVLYGIDLARKDIAKLKQVVVVEGYTDVMACHVAGITTAVATCGTAFGGDHVRIVRRLMGDTDASGEVIFTFDGDSAGQKAALRAFDHDQEFTAKTYVAVAQDNLDPCDLRIKHGDEAVQELIKNKVPMFEFVIKSTLSEFNLDTAEGRVAALRATAPIVAGIRDEVLRPEYARNLSGWLGLEAKSVSTAINQIRQGNKSEVSKLDPTVAETAITRAAGAQGAMEREALKIILQRPKYVNEWFARIEPSAFTDDIYRAVFEVVRMSGGLTNPLAGMAQWTEALCDLADTEPVRRAITGAVVEPLSLGSAEEELVAAHAISTMARLIEKDVTRRLNTMKLQMQQVNPTSPEYSEWFAQMLDLEKARRALVAQAKG